MLIACKSCQPGPSPSPSGMHAPSVSSQRMVGTAWGPALALACCSHLPPLFQRHHTATRSLHCCCLPPEVPPVLGSLHPLSPLAHARAPPHPLACSCLSTPARGLAAPRPRPARAHLQHCYCCCRAGVGSRSWLATSSRPRPLQLPLQQLTVLATAVGVGAHLKLFLLLCYYLMMTPLWLLLLAERVGWSTGVGACWGGLPLVRKPRLHDSRPPGVCCRTTVPVGQEGSVTRPRPNLSWWGKTREFIHDCAHLLALVLYDWQGPP